MSDLSPFYQEILSFLKSTASTREKQEGFDSKVDSDLLHFHSSIDAALSDSTGPLPMNEIIENYHHLFGERGPIHLEREWMNSFSEKEFADLGLSAYFPRIYRGLPRLYHRDNPARSHIKKNFTNLTDLKKLMVDKAIYSLYDRVRLPRGMKISIFSWIIPDGFGDWVAIQETATVLREKLPHLEIQLFFLTAIKLPEIKHFPTYEIHYYKDPSLSDFSLEVLKLFRDSDLILQIPTFFSKSDELWEMIRSVVSDRPMPAIENIGEYGFLESQWYHPKSHNRSMGLHALEKGIFIRKSPHCSFSEIDQKNLLNWLFATQTPGPIEIEAYKKNRHFYMGYLSTPMGGAVYLHSLLKIHERDEKDIDLCCPDLGWLIRWIDARKKNQLPLLEETFGLKEISILAFDQEHRMVFKDTGKVLRVLSPGIISVSDMRKLFYLSGEWVGVRGNQSFTEAVSAGKPFFYDGREHARYFIKDLIALAENRLTGHRLTLQAFRLLGQAFLWNLPEELGDWVDETHYQRQEKMPWFEIATELGNCLKDPDTVAGFKKFSMITAQEHSFNGFLCNLVQRRLYHTIHPYVRESEERQLHLFLVGKISFSALIKKNLIRIMQKTG